MGAAGGTYPASALSVAAGTARIITGATGGGNPAASCASPSGTKRKAGAGGGTRPFISVSFGSAMPIPISLWVFVLAFELASADVSPDGEAVGGHAPHAATALEFLGAFISVAVF